MSRNADDDRRRNEGRFIPRQRGAPEPELPPASAPRRVSTVGWLLLIAVGVICVIAAIVAGVYLWDTQH